jgi:xanthine/CO dehydrogenase XdhC/CoxF family maturation factor
VRLAPISYTLAFPGLKPLKHWQETERILDRLIRLAAEGRPAALAVVVRIEGSAYRRPGARLIIEEDGRSLGSVSGGCLEDDVRLIAQEAMGSGRPSLRHYETGTDDTKVWGLGLGCNGTVDVFVHPITGDAQRDVWRRVHQRLQGDRPFQVAIATAGPEAGRAWIVGEDDAPALDGSARVFTESFVPPPRLVVFGAGDDALPLVATASGVGWRVVLVDHRPAHNTAERFPAARERFLLRPTDDLAPLRLGPDTYAVVMTHSFKHDRDWAHRLLEAGLPYVGLLGPRQRAETILEETGATRRDRVYGPVGLDLGADGPEQVAVSIVAELMAVWSGRDARHLRTKELAVHA